MDQLPAKFDSVHLVAAERGSTKVVVSKDGQETSFTISGAREVMVLDRDLRVVTSDGTSILLELRVPVPSPA